MQRLKIERFDLPAITEALTECVDLASARASLSSAIGAAVEVSGSVEKRVRRDGKCKLVIRPNESKLIVFADCISDAATVQARKIRKGSSVSLRGKFQTFGFSAVCLSDCRLMSVSKSVLSDTLENRVSNDVPN